MDVNAIVQLIAIVNCPAVELTDDHDFVNGTCAWCPATDGSNEWEEEKRVFEAMVI